MFSDYETFVPPQDIGFFSFFCFPTNPMNLCNGYFEAFVLLQVYLFKRVILNNFELFID